MTRTLRRPSRPSSHARGGMLLGLLSFCCVSVSAASTSTEDSVRERTEAAAAGLLIQGDLGEFDSRATALRESRELTPAGLSKLAVFYRGTDRIAPNKPHAPVWAQAEAAAREYLQSHPDSPSAVIALVRVLNSHAEELRDDGGGADDDTLAAAYTGRAAGVLEEHREVGSHDPDGYASHVEVAVLQGAEKDAVMTLARAGLDADPAYQPLLDAVSNALLPENGGSLALHQEFVAHAVATSHAQLGDQLYGRIMFSIARRGTTPASTLRSVGVDWPRLKASLAEISAAYPEGWNAGVERAMACLLGSEADFNAAKDSRRAPRSTVTWYDSAATWAPCASLQQQQTQHEQEGNTGPQWSLSREFVVAVTAALVLCLGVLAIIRDRAAIANSALPAVSQSHAGRALQALHPMADRPGGCRTRCPRVRRGRRRYLRTTGRIAGPARYRCPHTRLLRDGLHRGHGHRERPEVPYRATG